MRDGRRESESERERERDQGGARRGTYGSRSPRRCSIASIDFALDGPRAARRFSAAESATSLFRTRRVKALVRLACQRSPAAIARVSARTAGSDEGRLHRFDANASIVESSFSRPVVELASIAVIARRSQRSMLATRSRRHCTSGGGGASARRASAASAASS